MTPTTEEKINTDNKLQLDSVMCRYFSLSCMFCWVLRPVKSNIIQAVLRITSNHDIVRLFKQTCLLHLQLWVLYHRGICLTDCCKTFSSLDLVCFYLTLGCVVNCRAGKDLHRVWVPRSSCLPFLQESQRSSPFNGSNYPTTCSRTWWLISPWPDYWLDVVEAQPVSRVLLPNLKKNNNNNNVTASLKWCPNSATTTVWLSVKFK